MAETAIDTASDDRRIVTDATWEAARALGLSQNDLARVLGVSASSVSRMGRGTFRLVPGDKHWELGLLLVRIYRALGAICAGDPASIRGWMTHYNHDLAAVPGQRIRSVHGLVEVLDYLDANRAIT